MSVHQSRPRVSMNPYPANHGHGGPAFDRGYHESMNGMVFGSNPYVRGLRSLAWEAGWQAAQAAKRTAVAR